jgi:CBS domain-containing protein
MLTRCLRHRAASIQQDRGESADLDEADPVVGSARDGVEVRFEQEKSSSWPVGTRNYIEGVISLHQIETAQPTPSTVRDLIKSNGDYPYVHQDHPLSYVLERMRQAGVDVLPVVSRANIRHMNGVVTLNDVLATYGVIGARTLKS